MKYFDPKMAELANSIGRTVSPLFSGHTVSEAVSVMTQATIVTIMHGYGVDNAEARKLLRKSLED